MSLVWLVAVTPGSVLGLALRGEGWVVVGVSCGLLWWDWVAVGGGLSLYESVIMVSLSVRSFIFFLLFLLLPYL